MLPVLAILALTAIWGYTFVPVKAAVEPYPVFAFLDVLIGVLLGVSLGLQTAGLARTTVFAPASSPGSTSP